jgi:predicted RNase H-like nuclease (RuvC/YqgF family)
MSLKPDDYLIYALVPIDQVPSEVAIRLKKSAFCVETVEALINEKNQLEYQLAKCKETILALKTQVLRKNNLYYDEKYMRRMEKLKKLNEDNKKLRELLKNQLDNSEALRKETQNTVEILREEFERLSFELNKNPRPAKSVIKATPARLKELKPKS